MWPPSAWALGYLQLQMGQTYLLSPFFLLTSFFIMDLVFAYLAGLEDLFVS